MFWKKKKPTAKPGRTTTLSEVLKGVTPGRIQSVGYIQVIPLLRDMVDDRFVEPEEAIVSTTGYGSMDFENPSDKKVLIIPLHAGYVVNLTAENFLRKKPAHAGFFISSGKTSKA
ncbi:MAG: hypothetical protein E3J72_07185 [Planctomycetota bacterium]|nr:MAG: hypothetical protein E3J72_07185 [Planctomycetota bacterium]